MDELIDIVNENQIPIGKSAQKSVIHSEGYYHNTAHIWLYTKNQQILLAQRAAKKLICPLLWDVSVAGHVDAGETIVEAAIREIHEEIGLKILEKNLEKIGVFKCFQEYDNGIKDNEFHHTFIAELSVPLEVLNYNKDEVQAIKLVSIEEFRTLLSQSKTNSHFVASNSDYYNEVINQIKNRF